MSETYYGMRYSEKQIRKAWKRATRRIEDELGNDPTIDVLMFELRTARRQAERIAESNETFTLGQLREAVAGPDGTWDISYYDAIVRTMKEKK